MREARLERLADAGFDPVQVDGVAYDPFDADAVNRALAPQGLVYSAGLVDGARPHFFLAELEAQQRAVPLLRVSQRPRGEGAHLFTDDLDRGIQADIDRAAQE